MGDSETEMTGADARSLAKLVPYILTALAAGGISFGGTSASDVNESKLMAVRAAVNEAALNTCHRDLNFWRDRAVSRGAGIE